MTYRQKIGKFGENLAKDFLIKNGYLILAQNIKTSYKEIDLIAQKEDILVFCEVRTRASSFFGGADEAMHHRKIMNFKRAVKLYLNSNNEGRGLNIRLDFIAIDIDKIKKTAKIKHFKDIL